jgi:hypothetical protein
VLHCGCSIDTCLSTVFLAVLQVPTGHGGQETIHASDQQEQ